MQILETDDPSQDLANEINNIPMGEMEILYILNDMKDLLIIL